MQKKMHNTAIVQFAYIYLYPVEKRHAWITVLAMDALLSVFVINGAIMHPAYSSKYIHGCKDNKQEYK